jgi:hypothetical protein
METVTYPELETVAQELVHRRWAVRAALVGEAGVLALCAAGPLVDREGGAPSVRNRDAADSGERVAHMVVESLDEQCWIYVDLGAVRLVARLARASLAAAATAWLIGELRRLGVTVERETLAQD